MENCSIGVGLSLGEHEKRVFLGPLVYYVKSESDRACGEIGCSNVSGVEPFLLCSTTFAFESSDKSLL